MDNVGKGHALSAAERMRSADNDVFVSFGKGMPFPYVALESFLSPSYTTAGKM